MREFSKRVMPYMDRYAASRIPHAEAILNILRERGELRFDKPTRILYEGCSFGHEPIHFARMTNWKIFAFDVDIAALREIPEFRRICKVAACDARMVSFKTGSFDAVVLNHVMDAALDYRGIVDEAWRVLKHGGRLYVANNNVNRLFCISVHESLRRPFEWALANLRFLKRKVSGSLISERYGDGEGFSYSEMMGFLAPFEKVECLDKTQLALRFGRWFLVKLVPASIIRRIGPNHIFLCKK